MQTMLPVNGGRHLAKCLIAFCFVLASKAQNVFGQLSCPLDHSITMADVGIDPDTLQYYVINYMYVNGSIIENPKTFDPTEIRMRNSGNRMMLQESLGDEAMLDGGALSLRSMRDVPAIRGLEDEEVDEGDDTSSNQTRKEPLKVVRVRTCWCASDRWYPKTKFFCPMDKPVCIIPRSFIFSSWNAPICTDRQPYQVTAAKNLWFVYMMLLPILIIACFCSTPGRNATDLLISTFIPCWNDYIIRSMLRRNPDRARLMIRRFHNRNVDGLEQRYLDMVNELGIAHPEFATSRGSELLLKTKVFKAEEYQGTQKVEKAKPEANQGDPTSIDGTIEDVGPKTTDAATVVDPDAVGTKEILMQTVASSNHNESDDNNQDVSCSICFVPLEDGDRIGALPCQHIFHVDCLKSWLSRRNVCPLCLHTNIAKPKNRRTRTENPEHG